MVDRTLLTEVLHYDYTTDTRVERVEDVPEGGYYAYYATHKIAPGCWGAGPSPIAALDDLADRLPEWWKATLG